MIQQLLNLLKEKKKWTHLMLDFSNEEKLLNQRSDFLKNLIESGNLKGDRLIKKLVLKKAMFANLQAACFNFISASLMAHEKDFIFKGDYTEFLKDNLKDIVSMSCVTPNGVIRPKYETISEFNSIQRALSEIIKFFGIEKNVKKVRAPISIRLVSSFYDQKILDRPRANNKLHSDFWTGAVCDFAVLIPVFGTIDTIDVVFCEPKGFDKSYLQEVTNYSKGTALYKSYDEYPTVMEIGSLFLQDIFCLHGTRRRGEGVRVSIDFTFQSNEYDEKILPYYSSKAVSSDNHIDILDWLKIGSEIMLVEDEKISYLRKNVDHYNATSEIIGEGTAIKLQTSKSMRLLDLKSFKDVLEFEAKKN